MYKVDGTIASINDSQVESIIELRSTIRTHIDNISELIEAEFSTKTMRLCVFALIVLIDEKLTPFYLDNKIKWVPLQKEIFNTQNGGVEFYVYLDEILVNTFYPKIIYEIYYYVLKYGYRGKFINETIDKVTDYLAKLENLLHEKKSIIEVEDLTIKNEFVELNKKQKLYKKLNEFFPVCSFVTLICVYLIISVFIYGLTPL